ncbi:MAG: NAD(P)H-dependent oxidoreductase [Pseudomonadota bacterium]
MSDTLSTLIVYGSVRRDRQGIGLARFIASSLSARNCAVDLIDPLESPLPLLDKMYKEYPKGEAPDVMESLANKIKAADGVVIVSGEYNHGIPPALKNLLDHYLEEWFFKPCGIACYSAGRYGGVRAAMQLRMTLAELGMPTISSLLAVPTVSKIVTADGDLEEEWLHKPAGRFFDELMWWMDAAHAKKAKAGTPF